MPKITINDIAKEAGVSIATVSRVFNKKNNVSKEVEDRVIGVVKRLGYKPHSTDDMSCAVDNNAIAVLLPSISNPFYIDILDGIQDIAVTNGYNMVIVQTKTESGFNNSFPDFLHRSKISGLISLEHIDNTKSFLTSIDSELPIVQCCEYDANLPYPYVAIDDYTAAYDAVSFLCTTGHKRIALINSTTQTTYGSKREQGYKDALLAHNLIIDPELIYHLNIIEFNIAYSAATKLLSRDNRPDAFFTVSDIYAVAAIRAAQHLALRVPEDVAVIGFDNIFFAAMNDPPLTTVNIPRYEIGRTAATTLMGLIHNHSSMSKVVLLKSELVVRGST